jgi:hypothetical protein
MSLSIPDIVMSPDPLAYIKTLANITSYLYAREYVLRIQAFIDGSRPSPARRRHLAAAENRDFTEI